MARNGSADDRREIDRPESETWLDYLEHRRDALIMELRWIDELLIQSGRLEKETIRRRVR